MGKMPSAARVWLVSCLLAAGGAARAHAQGLPADPPKALSPRPPSQKQLDHEEALRLYGQGLLLERKHQLLEATRAFEEAARLDPGAAAAYKALAPLYAEAD